MSFPSTSPGQAGLGYLGTKVANPIASVNPTPPRDPTPSDFNYDVGTVWLNRNLNRAFVLTSKHNGSAFWLPMAAGTANIFQLTPDVGGPIPSVAGNVNIAGGVGLQTVGAGNTVTITATGFPQAIVTTKFIANGTWTKNTATKYVSIYMWGGGAGGGGGSAQLAGTASSGGGGGAGGQFIYLQEIPASAFPASSAITVGAGGAGGAGSATAVSSPGVVGGFSQVTTVLGNITTTSATAGLGGTTTVAGGGIGTPAVYGSVTPGTIPSGNTGQSAAAGSVANNISPPGNDTGGGGAGGVNAAGVSFGGGRGGNSLLGASVILAGGAGGASPGGSGTNGVSPTTQPYNTGGTGGGGGAGSAVGAGGNGGLGFAPGGGGGGGGGVQGAFTGGNGGSGARGEVWIIEYF